MLNEEEIWKDVVGFEGLYQVSNKGRVKSLMRTVKKTIKGTLCHPVYNEKILTLLVHTTGRYRIWLSINDTKKQYAVHRLVLEAFIGPCPDGMECCHNNGDHTDNRLENLRWDTQSNNILDKKIHGTNIGPRGERCGASKLKDSDVLEIKKLLLEGNLSQRKIANRFKISFQSINGIKKNRTWTHIKPTEEPDEV